MRRRNEGKMSAHDTYRT